MADINNVVIVGRLTRDADLKFTASGMAITKVGLAVNRRKKSGDSWVDEVNFFDATIWGKQGEALNRYLTKGKLIGLEGELRQDRWEQDGQSRSKVYISVDNVQLLGGSGGNSQDDRTQQPTKKAPSFESYKAPDAPSSEEAFEDDIPF